MILQNENEAMKKLILPIPACLLLLMPCSWSQNVSIGHVVPAARLDIRGVAASPSIPGTTSTGVTRFAVGPGGGIDIGKMGVFPYLGWIQVGFTGTVTDPITLQPLGGNVGIGTGTSAPAAKLDVAGTIKIADGTQGAGKILTSDATGLASWQPPPPPPPTYYQSVSICCQTWMTKNLDVSTYRNGDAIPQVTDNAAWAALTTGAYCYYNNDSTTYAAIYGKLYNWYAVNDPRGLAPEGWHIPSNFESYTLGYCLTDQNGNGGDLKEAGTAHWASPNSGANNSTRFNGLPAGKRWEEGTFLELSENAFFWTSLDDSNAAIGFFFSLSYISDFLSHYYYSKKVGCSVRCIRD